MPFFMLVFLRKQLPEPPPLAPTYEHVLKIVPTHIRGIRMWTDVMCRNALQLVVQRSA